MSFIQIILSADFIIASAIYGIAILIILPLFDRIHNVLNHAVLQWNWDHIAMPLLQAALMVLFIFIAYPVIFGIKNAPSIFLLLSSGKLRINNLINLLFILTLLFPMVPVIGNWRELILPLQGIAASTMIFSWLAHALQIEHISYWPGLDIIVYVILVAIATHWLAVNIALKIGHKSDDAFNVVGSGDLIVRCLIIFMQSPAILLVSRALGQQLH